MAHTLTPEQARKQFEAVSHGKRPANRQVSVEQAKARLREVDAGLDLGPALRLAAEGNWKGAAVSFLPWLVSGSGREYFAPVLLKLAELSFVALAFLRGGKPASTSKPVKASGRTKTATPHPKTAAPRPASGNKQD